MNKINRPKFNDSVAISELISNSSLGYHYVLNSCLPKLKLAYKDYILSLGAPTGNYPKLTEEEGSALKYYYSSPPVSHEKINDIRRVNNNSLCPMCGSMHRGTLDHVLPKNIFPEFSIFSRNLVPACKCNSLKGITVSNGAGARILHPYYDKILGNRLISAKFSELGEFPIIDIKIILSSNHALYPSVVYHVDEVVKKNNIIGYLSEQWESFYLQPELIVRGLNPDINNEKNYFSLIKKELSFLDRKHKGKNNWNSVFVSGLYSRDVARWVLNEFKSINRDNNGSLI
ncbi:HNH endonuclease [Providencia alcalifaciens]|uniref:HNH endonuclease n=1 Tax=Providencia alcalifaciens TaxID=126385 RepID=UPI001CC7C9F3|nr:hypothetical protein NVI2019_GHJFPKLH_01444 [Providencia alcalifaciens]